MNSKRIAALLVSLPDEALLLLTKTRDQIEHWMSHRIVYTLVGCAWWARIQGKDDPLRPLVESKRLHQNDYNRIWQLVECYESLWALVQLTEPFLKATFKQAKLPYIFSSSYDLFICILQEQVNGEFSLCLTDYRIFSAEEKSKKLRELAHRIHEELPLLLQKEPHPTLLGKEAVLPAKSIKQLFWSQLLLSVAYKKANGRNKALTSALRSYCMNIAGLFGLEASFYRRTGSFTWHEGERFKGSRYGGKYEKSP